MSQSRPDTAFRPAAFRTRGLSAPQLRALRKELLILRASVERTEIAAAIVELRDTITKFNWLRFILPGFGRLRRSADLGANIGNLLKQYPVLSSLISMIIAKPLRNSAAAVARPLIKWGMLALTAWEAYRIWQQIRRQRDTSSSDTNDRTD